MKKKLSFFAMLVCLLALGAVLIGCPTDLDDGGGDGDGDGDGTSYTVTISQPANGGTIGASPKSGPAGTTVTLSNSPDSDYTFSHYTVDGEEVSGNTFALNKSVTVSGVFTPTGGGDQEPSGSIYISHIDNGPTTTMVYPGNYLAAVYTGDEYWTFFQYQWNKDGTPITGATQYYYSAPEVGSSYTVTISREGYQSKTSAAVIIGRPEAETATVSVGVNARNYSQIVSGTTQKVSDIDITLTLSAGVWDFGLDNDSGRPIKLYNWTNFEDAVYKAFTEAVTVTGAWGAFEWFTYVQLDYDLNSGGSTATITYYKYNLGMDTSYPQSSGEITVTLDSTKLADLLEYTTVSGSLSAGTTTASDSEWTE
jgi:hypothetical protein